MKQPSKQTKWQRRHFEQGLCHTCDQPFIEGSEYCEKHRDLNRLRNRNRYRKLAGIPLDAPLHTRASKKPEVEKKSFITILKNLITRK